MIDLALYRDLGIALAAGLLIGIERGWQQREVAAGTRVAGFRTFGLLGGLGGLVGLIGKNFHPLVPAVILAGAVTILVAGALKSMTGPDSVSATMLITALITICLGMLATSGLPAIAIAGAAITTLLLSFRNQLHHFVTHLGEGDIQALARFAIIAGAILPFLPEGRFGPYDAWSPRLLWMVVVLVTGFSFVSYIADRLIGVRYGTLSTAILGGMYSSTAVTASLSHQLHEAAEDADTLAAGIALASAVMFMRVLILTAVLAGFAFLPLAQVIGPGAVVAIVAGIVLTRKTKPAASQGESPANNPIAIIPAVGFLLMVAAMALAVRWAEARFGSAGIATVIVISGAFDVDAAIVTLGGLPAGSVAPELAGLVLAGPVIINTLFKSGIVLTYAGWARGRPAILALLAACAAVALVAVIILITQQGV